MTRRAEAAAAADRTTGRLLSLDVFRGLTIALMILVNNPGSWSHIHPPLRHAAWHGWTPTDLVFPFFLFIVGAAMALSFARRVAAGASRGDLVRKILVRSALIFACGLLLNGYPFGLPLSAAAAREFSLESVTSALAGLRVLGVLQRIALCYLAAGLAVVWIRDLRKLAGVAAACLVLYEILMRAPLVTGWGAGSFALEDNLVRWVDLQVLGEQRLWTGNGTPFDPEGLLSTLPAIATTLAGFLAGVPVRRLRGLDSRGISHALGRLLGAGAALTAAGLALGIVEPINKQLWSSSYTLLTAGLATIFLVACYWAIDMRGWSRGGRPAALPAIVFGSNPLIVFVGSGILARTLALVPGPGGVPLKRWLYEHAFRPLAGDVNGSLLHAIAHVLLWLGILWWLYRRRIFLKI